MLRFVNRYGTPVSFRFYFKAGTDVMEPRGYCFVEYSTREVCVCVCECECVCVCSTHLDS